MDITLRGFDTTEGATLSNGLVAADKFAGIASDRPAGIKGRKEYVIAGQLYRAYSTNKSIVVEAKGEYTAAQEAPEVVED